MENLLIKSVEDCSIDEITELWNLGFLHYFTDMTRTTDQIAAHLDGHAIHRSLSVAAYIDGLPAGFVLIGLKTVRGLRTAWNGGTGVNPRFRGQGIAKKLLRKAIRRMVAAGVDLVSLEVRTDNAKAIAAYQSIGFEKIHGLSVMSHKGSFSQKPFQRKGNIDYPYVIESADQVADLPFYLEQSAWNNQWFNKPDARSVIVYEREDRQGEALGYALFFNQTIDGQLKGVTLYHCEANPALDSATRQDITRYMLEIVYEFGQTEAARSGYYLRSTNEELMDAMREAGFVMEYEEYLMILHLRTQPEVHISNITGRNTR